MKYEIQDNVLNTLAKQFAQPVLIWRQAVLLVFFGLLLLLVILGCTVGSSPFIAVALIGALAIVVLAVLQPRFALLLVFIGAGLPSFSLPLPGHNLRPVEAAIWLCSLSIILLRANLRLRLPHLLALLFLAIAVISFIHVPSFSASVNAYTGDKRLYAWILMVLAFFCGTFLVRYVKDASSFLITVLLGNTPLYLISFAEAMGVSLTSLLSPPNGVSTGGRISGPFTGAADFGLYLVNLFAVALACWMLGRCRRDRVIGAFMTIITALVIIATGTRSAAIAVIILVIVSFTLTRHFKMLLGTLMMAGAMLAIFFGKILSLLAHDPTSASNRLFLWQEAIKLIIAHPWIGIGLWQFPKYYALFVVSLAARLDPHGGVSVHEQYLEWAMESGIFWLIVGVLLLLSIAYSCWRAYRLVQRKQQVLLLAAILVVLANMIMGFFDVPLDGVEGGVFLFLLTGLALGYAEWIRWGIPGQKTVAHLAQPLGPQVVSVTDIGSGLYWPLPRRPKANPPEPVHSSLTTNEAFSSTDAAPNMQKSGRSVVIQMLSWAIPIPIIFPMTALLTRYLGPIQYGEYSFMVTYVGTLSLFTCTGMDSLIVRQLSRQPRKEWSQTLSYAAGTRLVSTLLSIGAGAFLALVLPINGEQRNLLLLGSVSLLFSFSANGLRMIYLNGYLAEQRVAILSLLSIINRVITAVLVALVVLLHLSLLWACVLIIYSDLPFFIVLIIIARRRFGVHLRFAPARARELLLGGLPLMGYDILNYISAQADLLILMILAGAHSVGLYALASRIIDPLISIALAYMLGLYPLFCAKFLEGRGQFVLVYQQSVRIVALCIIPFAIYVSVEAGAIIALLGGQGFASAAIALQLLMWAMVVTFFNQLAARTCMAANLDRQVSYVTVISTIANILINLALIPLWGIMGAGLAALVSEFVALCLFLFTLRDVVPLLYPLGAVLRVILGNLPALAFLIWQQRAPLLLIIPIALVLTTVGCIATRTLSGKDIHSLRDMLHAQRDKETSKVINGQSNVNLSRIEYFADYPTVIMPKIHI